MPRQLKIDRHRKDHRPFDGTRKRRESKGNKE
jgi:hypothetical protein